jgi:3-hydroxyacyl-CoA dehydrogenase
MFFADQTGLHVVARALENIAAQSGSDTAFWTPAPLLTRLAREGRSFNGKPKDEPK